MKNNPFVNLKVKENGSIENSFYDTDNQKEKIKLIAFEDLVINKNPYPITELQDLIDSIKHYGLEQNLVVKKVENNKFQVVSGHRRYYAIQQILEHDEKNEYAYLEELYCKIINTEENEIITNLRLHETNFQNRNLLKLKEEEKLAIVEDYLHYLDLVRQNNLKINGKEIKGKTREILAERFNISESSAKRILQKIKGGSNDHPPKKEKTSSEKFNIIKNKLVKCFIELDEIYDDLTDLEKLELEEVIENYEKLK